MKDSLVRINIFHRRRVDIVFAGIPGYAKLSKEQQTLFENTYKKHMKCFRTDKLKYYTSDRIKSIRWSEEEKAVKVYFENGD